MTVDWLTFWALVATLFAIVWQAKATADAADAASKSAGIAKWNLEHLQVSDRAWISLERLDIQIPFNKKAGMRSVGVSFRNSGNTPATIHEANITVRGQLKDLPDVPKGGEPTYDSGEFRPPTVLVKDEVSTMWFPLENIMHSIHWLALDNLVPGQEEDLWIYGYVRYSDIFKPNKIRTYRWARRYDVIKTRQMGSEAIYFSHVGKSGYNYAD